MVILQVFDVFSLLSWWGDAALKQKEERLSIKSCQTCPNPLKSANVSTVQHKQTPQTQPQTQLEVKPYLAYTSTKMLFQTHCPPTPSWHASSQFHRPSLSSLRPLHKPPSNPAGISSMVDPKEWHHLGCLCWKWHHLQPACQREMVAITGCYLQSVQWEHWAAKKLFMKHRETENIPTWFVKRCLFMSWILYRCWSIFLDKSSPLHPCARNTSQLNRGYLQPRPGSLIHQPQTARH